MIYPNKRKITKIEFQSEKPYHRRRGKGQPHRRRRKEWRQHFHKRHKASAYFISSIIQRKSSFRVFLPSGFCARRRRRRRRESDKEQCWKYSKLQKGINTNDIILLFSITFLWVLLVNVEPSI